MTQDRAAPTASEAAGGDVVTGRKGGPGEGTTSVAARDNGGDKTTLTEHMRLATKEAHSVADAAVNLRLAGALADREKWGRAIAIFYVVVAKFEALVAAKAKEEDGAALRGVARVLEGGAARAAGFEADLLYYLGDGWSGRVQEFMTPGLHEYVAHMEQLAEENPVLLVPYAYHLHMGILSGGQIMRNTAKRAMGLPKSGEGVQLFSLVYRGERDGAVSRLKRDYRAAVDTLGEDLDEAQRGAMLAESVNCFRMNNVIVAELPWGASVRDLYRVLPETYQGYAKAATVVAVGISCAVAATAVLKLRQ